MPTINYSWSGAAAGGGDWLPYVVAVYGLLWILTLALVINRYDLDPVTRLLWVIVVIFVPLGGMLLYALFAPPRLNPRERPRGDLSGTPWEKPSRQSSSDT